MPTSLGVVIPPSDAPHNAVIASGGALSIDFAKPTSPSIDVGFASPNDGFADLSAGATRSWAVDNDFCRTSIANAAMTPSYAPMPPETPLCTVALSCGSATVTCAPSPETFILQSATGTVLGTFDGSGGDTPVFTAPSGGPTETYTACTQNSAGAQTCARVVPVSYTLALRRRHASRSPALRSARCAGTGRTGAAEPSTTAAAQEGSSALTTTGARSARGP